MNIDPNLLIGLIRDLDEGLDTNGEGRTEYLEVRRWNLNGTEDNEQDETATALIRILARERLGAYELCDIGAATLAAIDAKWAS